MLLIEALNIVIELCTKSNADSVGVPKQREQEAIELVQKTVLELINSNDFSTKYTNRFLDITE
jgi:hypothetical protein